MRLGFEEELASAYTSPAQSIRVLSEHWLKREGYCPNCGQPEFGQYRNNRPVADFFCPKCNEDFELKSQKGAIGAKLVDGAYRTMIERLAGTRNPNLFILNYDFTTLAVSNLFVVPKHFLNSTIIEKRKPLGASARRAGWVGCNILLRQIPDSGRIFLIRNSAVEPKKKVLSQWQQTLFLREQKEPSARGWLMNVMRCVEKLDRPIFTLGEIYACEEELREIYPGNRHIKEKIRQQLQVLRDKGYLEFAGRGNYRLVANIR